MSVIRFAPQTAEPPLVTLEALLAGASGMAHLGGEDDRRATENFGGGRAGLVALGAGIQTSCGFLAADGFRTETTIFGFNPQFGDPTAPANQAFVNQIVDFSDGGTVTPTHPKLAQAICCLNAWDRNYQHFLIEEVPRLKLVADEPRLAHLPIVLFDEPHVREFAAALGLAERAVFVGIKGGVEIGEAFFPLPVTQNIGEQTPLLHRTLAWLRTTVLQHSDPGPPDAAGEFLFFDRRPTQRITGAARVITNQQDVVAALAAEGVQHAWFDDLTLGGKIALASRAAVAVTPVGANAMNLLFTRNAYRAVIFINHPDFPIGLWLGEMLKALRLCDRPVSFAAVARTDPHVARAAQAYDIDAAALAAVVSGIRDEGL